ncbi:DUF3253 domain-containing protein [Arthrobacter sp. DNA4]|nr:DUF3253 domain-containing protein [Arthrobacter sp. DNA4]UTT68224.1 DUF3253 domain-containing protein [Arthrobacter sp. DNA4]
MAHAGGDGPDTPVGRQLEAKILELLASRAATSTICPSDAARAVGGDDWRHLMEPPAKPRGAWLMLPGPHHPGRVRRRSRHGKGADPDPQGAVKAARHPSRSST